MLFQIARLRAYILPLIAFCLNTLHCVFSVFKLLEDKLSHWLHLPNFCDMRKLLYNICTFSRNEAFTQRELSCASSSCFHKKTLAHSSHSEGLSPVCSYHMDLQTILTQQNSSITLVTSLSTSWLTSPSASFSSTTTTTVAL